MDVYETHINQFNHNKKFLSFGISNQKESFHDWEITVTFYAAIHLIEAILSSECSINQVHSHEDRDTKINDNYAVFGSIRKDYFFLKTLAWTARYSGYVNVSPDDSKQAQERLENIQFELRQYIK